MRLVLISILLAITKSFNIHNKRNKKFGAIPKFQSLKTSRNKEHDVSRHSHEQTQAESFPWYSDPTLLRDRGHIIQSTASYQDITSFPNSRFVLFNERNVAVLKADEYQHDNQNDDTILPLYMNFDEMKLLTEKCGMPVFDDIVPEENSIGPNNDNFELVYVAQRNNLNFWALNLIDQNKRDNKNDVLQDENVGITSSLLEQYPLAELGALRSFGDRLTNATDAAILATANGLLEFHRAHKFCSKCGSATSSLKGGACRQCTGSDCGSRVYPRIDSAAIMLVTSPCEEYALLGRKKSWPQGRYSTLAGFAEVGETLEQCCVREVFEESGVRLDSNSVQFIASQPWPFPRSLMVGFRAKAFSADKSGDITDLPAIIIDKNELDDVRWFHRNFVSERLEGGSTSLTFIPNEIESEFHVPGIASLARLLITQWATER